MLTLILDSDPHETFGKLLSDRDLGLQLEELDHCIRHFDTLIERHDNCARMWYWWKPALKAYKNIAWHYYHKIKNLTRKKHIDREYVPGDTIAYPDWYRDPRLHASHRAWLLRSSPSHYKKLWPDIDATLPLIFAKPSQPIPPGQFVNGSKVILRAEPYLTEAEKDKYL